LDSSVSLPWVIYFEAFYLHVVSSFCCIPVICPKGVVMLNTTAYPTQQSSSPSRGLRCSQKRGNDVSPEMEEMPSLNMPVQRLKVAILPLDLPCSGPVTHSGQILTTGKSHGKKPDRFSLNDNIINI